MRLFVAYTLLLVLSACSHPDRRTSVLWTDAPEIVGAVERFNSEQQTWHLLLEYHSDLPGDFNSAVAGQTSSPDLLIGRSLNLASVRKQMSAPDFVFDHGEVARDSFYRNLLEIGSSDSVRLLPLSFDLPILVYSTEQLPEIEPLSLKVERVRSLSAKFQASVRNKGFQLAFSPLWGRFALDLVNARGANFTEDFRGQLSWDSTALQTGLLELADWTSAEAQGWKTQNEFTSKYLSTSAMPLLQHGVVLFYPSTLSEFLTAPYDERRGLDFRYLEVDGKITATDSVLWAGTPLASASPDAAQQFLIDFLGPARQKSLAQWILKNEFRPFGLGGGLSSVIATNSYLPTLYSELLHKLPPESQLRFWHSLPSEWVNLRDQVIVPWMAKGPLIGKSEDLLNAVNNYGKPSVTGSKTP